MADDKAPSGRGLRGYGSAAAVVLGWVGVFLFEALHARPWFYNHVPNVVFRVFSGFPAIASSVWHLVDNSFHGFLATYALTLFFGTLVVPLGAVARMVARARIRAGYADFLARAKAWLASRRAWRMAIEVALPLLSQAVLFAPGWWWHRDWLTKGELLAVAAAGALVQTRVARAGLRALLAPVMGDAPQRPAEIDPDEIRFDAVAVTRETRLAVVALALVSLAVATWIATLPILALFKDPRIFAVVGGYVALAAASAAVFRRASRISVGVDGIYVGGTSRARFYAYRDLDEVRVRSGDLELVKRERVVLRLQLHGEDAARRDAIVARIQAALARVKEVERDAAANFVTSRSRDRVASSVRGGADYRMPSVSQDALWALVEGSGVDAVTRTAAAEALASAADGSVERERLRVAAAHCADPRVRVVLEELALAEDAEAADVARRAAT